MTRTWTATIEVRDSRTRETISVDATQSIHDLLSDQRTSAVREAAIFLDLADEVHVTLWKRTNARGKERDRIHHVFRDRRGTLRYT